MMVGAATRWRGNVTQGVGVGPLGPRRAAHRVDVGSRRDATLVHQEGLAEVPVGRTANRISQSGW